MDEQTRRQGDRAIPRRCIWLRASVFFGLGALLMLFFLLPGCGSDSQPVKSEKTAAHKGSGSQASVPLLLDNQDPHRAIGKGAVAKEPARKTVVPPDISKEELDRRSAEAQKIAESPGVQVMPGITREEMDRRNAEAQKIAETPGLEIMPGVTKEEMARRTAEAEKSAPPWFVRKLTQESDQAVAQPPARPHVPPATAE